MVTASSNSGTIAPRPNQPKEAAIGRGTVGRVLARQLGKICAFVQLRAQGLRFFLGFDNDMRGVEFGRGFAPVKFGDKGVIGFGNRLFADGGLGGAGQGGIGHEVTPPVFQRNFFCRGQGSVNRLHQRGLVDQLVHQRLEQRLHRHVLKLLGQAGAGLKHMAQCYLYPVHGGDNRFRGRCLGL